MCTQYSLYTITHLDEFVGPHHGEGEHVVHFPIDVGHSLVLGGKLVDGHSVVFQLSHDLRLQILDKADFEKLSLAGKRSVENLISNKITWGDKLKNTTTITTIFSTKKQLIEPIFANVSIYRFPFFGVHHFEYRKTKDFKNIEKERQRETKKERVTERKKKVEKEKS